MAAGHATPPPPLQTGTDCAQATYASDMRVCADAGLLALDRRIGEAWRALAEAGATLAPGALIEPQDVWFRRRSRCAFSPRHTECLRAAYGERVTVLAAWRRVADVLGQVPPGHIRYGPGRRARCRAAPWGDSTVAVERVEGGSLTITSATGRLLAVAVRGTEGDDWTPYLGWVDDGRPHAGLRLLPLGAPAFECAM